MVSSLHGVSPSGKCWLQGCTMGGSRFQNRVFLGM
jgi:hypothetical protein